MLMREVNPLSKVDAMNVSISSNDYWDSFFNVQNENGQGTTAEPATDYKHAISSRAYYNVSLLIRTTDGRLISKFPA
jgi:hypothetical protein